MIYVNAKWQIVPDAGTRTYDLVVLHTVENLETDYMAEAVANYFATTDRKASTHYVVDADSEVQCVPEENICYGAGGANRNGIHIEHAGYAAQTREEWLDDYGRAMLARSASLTRDICARRDIPIVFLDAAALLATTKPRGITTHAEVDKAYKAPDPHWDPGPGFPIDYYLDLVKDDMTKEEFAAAIGAEVATSGPFQGVIVVELLNDDGTLGKYPLASAISYAHREAKLAKQRAGGGGPTAGAVADELARRLSA